MKAEQCAGGQFVGAPLAAAGAHEEVEAPRGDRAVVERELANTVTGVSIGESVR